jgi:hypothetical protein
MRWIIKHGPFPGDPKVYWCGFDSLIDWDEKRVNAKGFTTRQAALRVIEKHRLFFGDARPVRVLSVEEAKRRFAAKVLLEMATGTDDREGEPFMWKCAEDLLDAARELWPVRGER